MMPLAAFVKSAVHTPPSNVRVVCEIALIFVSDVFAAALDIKLPGAAFGTIGDPPETPEFRPDALQALVISSAAAMGSQDLMAVLNLYSVKRRGRSNTNSLLDCSLV